MYSVFTAKLGSGAAKVGKKVAQSEAGRSAGRAAIKGASDAAAKDLSNRYFGEESQTTVTQKVATTTKSTSKKSTTAPRNPSNRTLM